MKRLFVSIYKSMFLLSMIAISLTYSSCSGSYPKETRTAKDSLSIYPDYKDIVIPCNIAPMNFMVDNDVEKCAVKVTASNGSTMEVVSGSDKKICFSKDKWKKLLTENKEGGVLTFEVCAKKNVWYKYPSFTMTVVADSIDPYVTCRLIEPLYNATGKIGLFQFSTEEGNYKVLASNKRYIQDPSHIGPKCVNCHTKQRNGSHNALFFCREKGGGMVLTYNGKSRIVNTKVGDLRVSAVFSAWHPNLPYIAFSNNKVMQLFMSKAESKIEPLDYYSDLLLYDIEKNEVSYIRKTKNVMETNPYWSPDGKYLYYCSSDSVLNQNVTLYQKMKYDLMRVSFNPDSLTWGEPELIYHASKEGFSASKPKVSPDSRYVLFTLSEFSGYHYSHPDSDIYLYDLQNNTCRNMTEFNTNRAEGIADWCSNGRWILVSSRVDGTYARLFFSYFDQEAKATKRFQLPHEDPAFDRDMTKNYNSPEFGNFDVQMSPRELYDLIDQDDILTANYRGTIEYDVDATSGASTLNKK